MSSDGSVPETGQEVLAQGAFLKVEGAVAPQQVKVHDGVQRPGGRVTITTCGAGIYLAKGIAYGKYFFGAVLREGVLQWNKRCGIGRIKKFDHRYCKG
jgi:hypothetical protein